MKSRIATWCRRNGEVLKPRPPELSTVFARCRFPCHGGQRSEKPPVGHRRRVVAVAPATAAAVWHRVAAAHFFTAAGGHHNKSCPSGARANPFPWPAIAAVTVTADCLPEKIQRVDTAAAVQPQRGPPPPTVESADGGSIGDTLKSPHAGKGEGGEYNNQQLRKTLLKYKGAIPNR
ncbi:hypothetical protein NDU88_000091 [Pleurodeles waltl]|uniref:Uncharacterized protein n=1 Tax=Pleurodeles waltl TaxID=8319 RepID=A0AAV7TEG4_PLEWA|nr:hypothetical protein NDU88_000091 [Pleurodeles waltl]